MDKTLADIVSKIASQGSNPDVSFLKDNPQAQAMLLLALLSNSANNNKNNKNNSSSNNSSKDSSHDNKEETDGDKRKFDSIDETPRKVGRKPVTSEDDDSDDPKNKRKAQNRAAQRAFRERKENRVRELQEKVKELEDLNKSKNNELQLENDRLKQMIDQLQKENATLLSSTISFDYPLSSTNMDEQRPQKIIKRSSLDFASPNLSHFDSPSSFSSSSESHKSRSNTPEKQKELSIDDILGLSTSELPSTTLLDHSELLGYHQDDKNLDSILQGQTFASDPSQFDFFYPLEAAAPADFYGADIRKNSGSENAAKDVTKVWDELSKHPRFEEFDMDVLCDEMTKKATCDGTEDHDHDEEMKKLVDYHYPIDEHKTL